jgi:lactate dehydrogenase-like 2-hydroxyacid dehydrogenase
MGSAIAPLRAAMAEVVVDNIEAIVQGRQPPYCWNAQALAAADREKS